MMIGACVRDWIAGLAVLALPGLAAAAEIHTGPVDRAAFRALVDGAAAGDTILCGGGLYDFSDPGPISLDKPLRIVAEDPEDPPVFRGSGAFFTDFFAGNNGFMVVGLQRDVDGLEFDGLRLVGFDRALVFAPGVDPPVNTCAPNGAGTLSGLRVTRCRVEASRRGIQLFGRQIERFEITDNIVTGPDPADSFEIGIMVHGGISGCAVPPGFYTPGRPAGGHVARNRVEGHSFAGIWAVGVECVVVRDNVVRDAVLGVVLGDNVATLLDDDGPIRVGQAIGNVIEDTFYGVNVDGPTTMRGSSVASNEITRSFIGVMVEQGANGFVLNNNEIVDSRHAAVLLGKDPVWANGPHSHDNTVVVTDFVTTVADYGIDNKIVGALARTTRPASDDEAVSMRALILRGKQDAREP
jgi:hypothetical protein